MLHTLIYGAENRWVDRLLYYVMDLYTKILSIYRRIWFKYFISSMQAMNWYSIRHCMRLHFKYIYVYTLAQKPSHMGLFNLGSYSIRSAITVNWVWVKLSITWNEMIHAEWWPGLWPDALRVRSGDSPGHTHGFYHAFWITTIAPHFIERLTSAGIEPIKLNSCFK